MQERAICCQHKDLLAKNSQMNIIDNTTQRKQEVKNAAFEPKNHRSTQSAGHDAGTGSGGDERIPPNRFPLGDWR